MAKRQADNVTPIKSNEAPEGFVSVTPEREAGWFKAQEGLIVQGELMGRFKMQDKDGTLRYYYQMRMGHSVMASVRSDDGKKFIDGQVPEGALLNIDEKKALEDLEELAADSTKRWAIWLMVGAKQSLDGGRTFWPMTVKKMLLNS